jgi:fructokinase
LTVKTVSTGQVRVDLQGSQHSFRILPEQAYDYVNAKVARLVTLSRKPDLIYFGTLAQRHPVSRQALRTLLKTAEAPRFLDLNLRAPWYDEATLRESLHAAEVVKLNLEELAVLAGMFDLSGQSARDHGRNLMQSFPIQKLVVTAGPRGAWLLHADGCEAYVEGGDETPIVDSVGAGDAFAAVFILGLLRDWPSALALERADAFARAICGIRGAVPMNEDLHARFLADWGR